MGKCPDSVKKLIERFDQQADQGVRKFFLETKKPFVKIKESWEPAYQIRRYGWSAKLAVSLLTDFEEMAIYDCRIAPKQLEKASTARWEYIGYRDYCDRWDFLEGTFSKQAVLRGDFDRCCQTKKGRGHWSLQRKIDATDREIDELVYEFFGLTD